MELISLAIIVVLIFVVFYLSTGDADATTSYDPNPQDYTGDPADFPDAEQWLQENPETSEFESIEAWLEHPGTEELPYGRTE